jgi:oxaloacetate decarboxylase alpha subunit
LTTELSKTADEKGIAISGVDDVLTYALFPQVGLKFLEHRGDPGAFEPPPDQMTDEPATAAAAPAAGTAPGAPERYKVRVNGKDYDVVVAPGGELAEVVPAAAPAASPSTQAEDVTAPLAGSVFRVLVQPGQSVKSGEVLVIMEAMKMETEVRSPRDGTVASVSVKEGDTIELGQALVSVG